MCHITPREIASALLQAISPFPHLLVFQPLIYGPVTESQVFRVAETLSTHRMSQPAKQSHRQKAYHVEEHLEEEEFTFLEAKEKLLVTTVDKKDTGVVNAQPNLPIEKKSTRTLQCIM